MQGGHPQQPQGGHPHESSGLYPPQQQGGHPQHEGSGLYPPQQQGYPPQQHGYHPQQHGYGHYPQHGPPKGKGKLIAIIAAVAALAVGGIVLAVVLSKKSSSSGDGFGGAATSEALAKRFIEALAGGDGDKLVALVPSFDGMLEYADCPADQMEKNKKEYSEGLDHTRQAAPRFKGHGLVYKAVEPLGDRKDYPVGEDLGNGCKVKKALAMQNFMVEFEYDGADKSKKTFKTNMFTFILNDAYYLSPGHVAAPTDIAGDAGGDAPPPDTPPATPDTPPTTSPELAAARTDLDVLRAEVCACPDRACADQVLTKRKAYAEKYALVPGVMDDPAIQSMGNELMTCMSAKMSGSSPTPPEPPTPPGEPPAPGKGLPECEAYAAAAERFIKCGKVPKQSRDAVKTAVDTMRKNWGDPAAMSDDMRRSAAETCVTLEKSMKDAAAAIGCK